VEPAIELDREEARALGALIEKDMATPDYYPLSLNALMHACNQKSNRDPMMSMDEEAVVRAVEGLCAKQLARTSSGEGRVAKYGHRASETLGLGNRELAALCVLLLRGAQTAGEIRARTQSLRSFDDLESVEACLRRLEEQPDGALVKQLPRQPGRKEPRWVHLLSGETAAADAAAPPPPPDPPDRIARLEAEVERLRREVVELRRQMEQMQGGGAR